MFDLRQVVAASIEPTRRLSAMFYGNDNFVTVPPLPPIRIEEARQIFERMTSYASLGASLAELEAGRSVRSNPDRRHAGRGLWLACDTDRMAPRVAGLGLRARVILHRYCCQSRYLPAD